MFLFRFGPLRSLLRPDQRRRRPAAPQQAREWWRSSQEVSPGRGHESGRSPTERASTAHSVASGESIRPEGERADRSYCPSNRSMFPRARRAFTAGGASRSSSLSRAALPYFRGIPVPNTRRSGQKRLQEPGNRLLEHRGHPGELEADARPRSNDPGRRRCSRRRAPQAPGYRPPGRRVPDRRCRRDLLPRSYRIQCRWRRSSRRSGMAT